MRSLVLLSIIAACSNGSKRDDVPPMPAKHDAARSVAPAKVYLTGPEGEVGVTIEVVDTPPKIQKGLMYRDFLPPDDGMLFLMGFEEDHGFYMRNTLISLDIIFITKEMTVAGWIDRAVPRDETVRTVGKRSLYVLEVNGGWMTAKQIAQGAKVRFENVKL